MTERYDRVIFGAGIYGLYAALRCSDKGYHTLVIEWEKEPFSRATYVNQARVHLGYHYPRSLSTALKSKKYFDRFNSDFSFCINDSFDQIYATSAKYSWTNGMQFYEFCKAAQIQCEELNPNRYFKRGKCDAAYLTKEYSYDANLLRLFLIQQLEERKNVEILFQAHVKTIERAGTDYIISLFNGKEYATAYILNATYASCNQIIELMGYEKFKIKYELCEIILVNASDVLKPYGFTIMDGPFFSIMPFGKTGDHSLTSVTFTPHSTCYKELPEFLCQNESSGYCSVHHLGNCNLCKHKPETAFPYMNKLAKLYLKDEYEFLYKQSLFSIKPILASTEIDDARPTVIRIHSESPFFASVLSGKINTVYDLEEVL